MNWPAVQGSGMAAETMPARTGGVLATHPARQIAFPAAPSGGKSRQQRQASAFPKDGASPAAAEVRCMPKAHGESLTWVCSPAQLRPQTQQGASMISYMAAGRPLYRLQHDEESVFRIGSVSRSPAAQPLPPVRSADQQQVRPERPDAGCVPRRNRLHDGKGP